MNSIPAKKYTKALVSALSDKEIQGVLKVLQSISAIFGNKDFSDIINSPSLPAQKKLDFLLGIATIKDKKLLNFIKILNAKNRLCEIPNIYEELNRYIRAKNNEYELVVQSNFALDSSDLEHIKKQLERKLKVSLFVSQKKSNIEGIKLFVDGMGLEGAFLKQSFTNGIKSHILKAFN